MKLTDMENRILSAPVVEMEPFGDILYATYLQSYRAGRVSV